MHREAAAAQISFPRQITSRAYLRERDQLRARDDSDFFMGDDEDEEEDAITAETEEDDAVDADNDAPLDEPLTIPEEESDPFA